MIKLREKRRERGLTQAELAAKVRHADPTADQTTISVLERGDLYPGEKLRDALCEALECTEADLYDGVEAFFVPATAPKYSPETEALSQIFAAYEKTFGSTGPLGAWYLQGQMAMIFGTPYSERKLRKAIQKARQEGMVICNAQNGEGYFLPRTKEDLERQYKQNQNRALAILKQQKHIRRRINGY